MRTFPDVEALAKYLNEHGWSGRWERKESNISGNWTHRDPFNVTFGYSISFEVFRRSSAVCTLSFDGGARLSIERLVHEHRLRRLADDQDPIPPGFDPPKSKTETYWALVGERDVIVQFDLRNDGRGGSIAIMTDR